MRSSRIDVSNSTPRSRSARRRSTVATLVRASLACAVLAWGLFACSEEELPENEFPVITQVSTTCEMVDTMDIAGPVLTGGEIVTLDEMVSSVTVDVPGFERMILSGTAIPEEAEPLETPQTWTFSVPSEAQVLCSNDLVLSVEVIDEFGQRTARSVVASP